MWTQNFTDSVKTNCQEVPTSSKSYTCFKSYTSFITSLGQCRPNFEIISTNWSVSIHSWSWMFSTKCSTLCLHQALHWSFQKIPHQLSYTQVYHPSSSVINVPSSFKSIFHCGCIVFKDNNGTLFLQSIKELLHIPSILKSSGISSDNMSRIVLLFLRKSQHLINLLIIWQGWQLSDTCHLTCGQSISISYLSFMSWEGELHERCITTLSLPSIRWNLAAIIWKHTIMCISCKTVQSW